MSSTYRASSAKDRRRISARAPYRMTAAARREIARLTILAENAANTRFRIADAAAAGDRLAYDVGMLIREDIGRRWKDGAYGA